MSTELSSEKGITITQYGRGLGKGLGYQVTWPNQRHDFDYISFDNLETAKEFKAILLTSIEIVGV